MEYPEIDWSKPLRTHMNDLPVKLVEDEDDCKWVKIGSGLYMFNNDGTSVEEGIRIFNQEFKNTD